MSRHVQIGFVIAVLLFSSAAFAQVYPNRHVTIVVGFTPGGAVDLIMRTVGAELSKILGQQVIVENRPGAGGTIGAEAAARAAPNGYTLFGGGMGPNATAHTLYPNLQYHSIRDFAPITLVAENPNVLAVHPAVPATNAAALIQLAKSKPGMLTYASAGNGSAQHVAAELFKSMAKVNIVHVPYKGVPEGLTGLLAGEIDLMFPPIFNGIPLMKAGKIKVLGVTTIKRSPILPDMPTIAESGIPGYQQTVWHALLAPAGTPRAIVSKLNDAVAKVLTSKDVKSKLESLGATPISSTPEELAVYMKNEIDKWAKVIKEASVKID